MRHPILKKIFLSISFTVFLMFFGVFFAGGGHGTYLPLKIMFPYSMIIANYICEINSIAILIAFVQIPVYTLLICNNSKWKYYIITFHIVAVIFVLNLKNINFS